MNRLDINESMTCNAGLWIPGYSPIKRTHYRAFIARCPTNVTVEEAYADKIFIRIGRSRGPRRTTIARREDQSYITRNYDMILIDDIERVECTGCSARLCDPVRSTIGRFQDCASVPNCPSDTRCGELHTDKSRECVTAFWKPCCAAVGCGENLAETSK